MSGLAPPVARRPGRPSVVAALRALWRHQPDAAARPARRRWPRGRSSSASGASCRSRARPSASRSPRFEVTSECSSSRMTRLSPPKKRRASRLGEQQRQLLGRGQQMSGGPFDLALALVSRRVAGAGLDPDRQAHLARPAFRDCARCRPPAPSGARCRACAAPRSARRACAGRGWRPVRRGSAGSRPASCPRRSARPAAPSVRPAPWRAAAI